MSEAAYFQQVQTESGWGRVLQRLVDWIDPGAGWLTLDVGCGPGLLPALLARRGCRSLGADLDPSMFRPAPLHPAVAVAEAGRLPFAVGCFDLITASNLLFLLPDPGAALGAMVRLLRRTGQLVVLNPSERLNVAAMTEFAQARRLEGFARQSLLHWAGLAEAHRRWSEADLAQLFAEAGLTLVETALTIGPGFARLARGVPGG
jgi:ubiquinone/menaquinone biosynthesis C-methylase UbiE